MKKDCSYFLIDCNNFFVSCERVFQPKLNNRPVLVLSSNDGCVVARSNEVKALDIKMGIPEFKIRNLIKMHQIKVCSSNYHLYGDMSSRIMDILSQFTPELEIYSIDEAFLKVRGKSEKERAQLADTIIKKVMQWTGIPVSVGIAKTKTLAKLACFWAKKSKQSYLEIHDPTLLLNHTKLIDIWGIGRKNAHRLYQNGYNHGAELMEADPTSLRKQYNLHMERTVLELQGHSCIALPCMRKTRKSIICSRSFGSIVKDIQIMKEPLSEFTNTAVSKLRKEGLRANLLTVYIYPADRKGNRSVCYNLHEPSNDTRVFLKHVYRGLKALFRTGEGYKKAGIMLNDLVSAGFRNQSLLELPADTHPEKSKKLYQIIDQINEKSGRGTIKIGFPPNSREWKVKRDKASSAYTSSWNQLLEIHL